MKPDIPEIILTIVLVALGCYIYRNVGVQVYEGIKKEAALVCQEPPRETRGDLLDKLIKQMEEQERLDRMTEAHDVHNQDPEGIR